MHNDEFAILVEQAKRAAHRAEMGATATQPGKPQPAQTRFGNTVMLEGLKGAANKLHLLDVKLEEIDRQELWRDGSWVLSMSAYNTLGDDLGLQVLSIIPVVATITIGNGGATIPFQVSVIQGTTLQLPVGSVSVDVQLTTTASLNVRVTGVIQRATSDADALLTQEIPILNAATPQSGPLPNFASHVRIRAAANSPVFSAQFRYVFGGDIDFFGPQMKEILYNGDWVPVGTGRNWQIINKPTTAEINYGTGFFPNFEWRMVL